MFSAFKNDGIISSVAANLHNHPAVLALLAELAEGKTFDRVVEEASGKTTRGTLVKHRTTLYQTVNCVLDAKCMTSKVTWDTVDSTIHSLVKLEKLPGRTTDTDNNVVNLPFLAVNNVSDDIKQAG